VEKTFHKDLSHISWEEVYARQMTRAHLMGEWMDSLELMAGDTVLEVGAGLGYMSLVLADRVGTVRAAYTRLIVRLRLWFT